MTKALQTAVRIGIVCVAAACSSRGATTPVTPADPETTVSNFMAAVQANDLDGMGALWGTKDGPMGGGMDRLQLERRLSIMQRYLAHERYELVPSELASGDQSERRLYEVVITRLGCVHRIPFELARVSGGWLVANVDLTQAGNPGLPCNPSA